MRFLRETLVSADAVFSGRDLVRHEPGEFDLNWVGAPTGDSLRGPALASYVLVEARDGYRVTFALAETSASFTDKLILLADRKDGAPLSSRDGPFQLVVPDEKRPARGVRQVSRISVVQLPSTPRQ